MHNQNHVTKVSVIGLGKLGATMAVCFAARGVKTIGVDVNPKNVDDLQHGIAPVQETGLQALLDSATANIQATQYLEKAVLESDISFIIVPTPSEPGGGFSLKYALAACESFGQVLRSKDTFHLVVMTSTVMPGATGGPIREMLEQTSGKQCGRDFGLCYSPEFIALGSIIRNFLNPDFLLIGESDERSGKMLEAFYQNVVENHAPVARMSLVNAELTKISVNTFVTTKITFANMLSQLCERLPGGDIDVVTAALGLDTRIGGKYLKGATGYGGPCFPRDNLALTALARQIGTSAPLAETTDQCNRQEVQRLAELVKQYLPDGGTAGILGLSYKPETGVIEESQGILLAKTLIEQHFPVIAYDPVAMDNARQVFSDDVLVLADSLETCIQNSDVIILITPWEEFGKMTPDMFTRSGTPRVLIDCWRILEVHQFASSVHYIALGIGMQQQHD